jgi:hypothetical protein
VGAGGTRPLCRVGSSSRDRESGSSLVTRRPGRLFSLPLMIHPGAREFHRSMLDKFPYCACRARPTTPPSLAARDDRVTPSLLHPHVSASPPMSFLCCKPRRILIHYSHHHVVMRVVETVMRRCAAQCRTGCGISIMAGSTAVGVVCRCRSSSLPSHVQSEQPVLPPCVCVRRM